jgi:hypothetical protein
VLPSAWQVTKYDRAASRTLVRMELAHYAEAFTTSRGRCFRFVAGDLPCARWPPLPG